jgi:SPP1 gp7 family putative phage head morphogenesis protein
VLVSRRSRARRRPNRVEVTKTLPPSVYSGNVTNTPQTYGLADAINALTSRSAGAMFNPMPRNALDATPFGPLNPLRPAPLDPARPDTGRPETRVTEYPVAWNIPGNEQRLVPWSVLREAARTVDVMRRCIEIRKRHIRSLKWCWTVSADTIQEAYRNDPRRGHDDVQVELREKFYPQIQRLTEFWQRPWRSNGLGFGQWINGVLEHHLVFDAIPVYPRTTYRGDLLDLELVDPTTIKPLLDWRGARPLPPFPAYQQVLYGFPRGEFEATADVDDEGNQIVDRGYLADQLYYHVENFRYGSWPYGFSAVEQALISARLYLRRQGWMLSEYDDGSTPLTWMIPEGSGDLLDPRQRREWEIALNDELSGQTAARHRVKVAFPGFRPEMMPSVDERYKPEYDLYLLKLLASHFGVTIAELGFTEAKGLGSSGYHEGQEDVQDRVGRRPDTEMLASIVEDLSRTFLDAPPELEFQFLGLESEDEAAADLVAKDRMGRGSMTVNEDRRRIGLPLFDFPEADMPMVETGRGVVFLDGASQLVAPGQVIGPGQPSQAPTDPDSEAQPDGQEPVVGTDSAGQDDSEVRGVGQRKPQVGKHATPNPSIGDAVYRQLLEDYPPEALTWVRAAHWQGPTSVPTDRIDYSNSTVWQADHEQSKVDLFADRIQAGKMKPIILVREPHNPKLIVVDGHHRALAYRKLNRPAVAYIARVGTASGPWDEMHDLQYHGGSGSTANSEPVSAPPALDKGRPAFDLAKVADIYTTGGAHPVAAVATHFDVSPRTAARWAKRARAAGLLAKAGGGGDDPKARDWPGWAKDLAVADHWAPVISQALTGAIPVDELVQRWLRLHGAAAGQAHDVQEWLAGQNLGITEALAGPLRGAYTDGYLVGALASRAVLGQHRQPMKADGLSATIDWGTWTPGDTAAAQALLSADGSGGGLQDLLDNAGVTISGIADTRLDQLAAILGNGVTAGDSPGAIARKIRDLVDDPRWARMVALTETTRASTAATLGRYARNGVDAKSWASAKDDRVCRICDENEEAGAVPLGAVFPDGSGGPPAHPLCRCALYPEFVAASELSPDDLSALGLGTDTEGEALAEGTATANSEADEAGASLDDGIASGVADEVPLGGGASAETNLVTFNDGTKAVEKIAKTSAERPPTESTDAETLAAKLGQELGIRMPDAYRVGDNTVYLRYVADAETGIEKDLDERALVALADSLEGQRLGLFDLVVGNTDRNEGNWLLDAGDRLWGIDHGMAFQAYRSPAELAELVTGRNPFAGRLLEMDYDTHKVTGGTRAYSLADIEHIRAALRRLEAEFTGLGRRSWFKQTMTRLNWLAKHAQGEGTLFG